MASAVRVEPNHYEVLGLSPAASQADIARAFRSAMSLFGIQPVALATRISEAFEVLRNPAKREAYNRSIGLEPLARLYQWQYKLPDRPNAQSKISPPTSGPEHRVAPPKPQETRLAPEARPKAAEDAAAAEAKISALVMSLKRLAEPAAPAPELPKADLAPRRVAEARPPNRPERTSPDPVDPLVEDILALGRAEKAELRKAEFRFPGWRRPAMALGGLVVGAAIIGVMAGLSVAGNQDAASELTTPLPTARPHSAAIADAPQPDPAADVRIPDQPTTSPVRAEASISRRARIAPPTAVLAASDQAPVENENALNSEVAQPDASATDPLAPTPATAERIAARMPLPGNVVARTIGRIGYRCGEVASMTAIEGDAGAFKVTCNSGDSYRAAPLQGRYHFRRMTGR